MENILVSVIIPSYKPQKYLFDCLDSIVRQGEEVLNIIEVFVIINGDKEPYYSDINEYVKSYSNFKVFYIDSKGVSFARNYGLSEAKGQYILFLDDDDFLSNNYISDLIEVGSKRSSSIIVSNFMQFIEEKDLVIDDYMTKYFFSLKNKNSKKYSVLDYSKFMSSSCGKLIPRLVIGKKRFDSTKKISEDALFMFSISNAIVSIELSSVNSVYYRRVRKESASRSKRSRVIILKNWLGISFSFISIYVRDPKGYNVLFLINRLLASFKFCLLNLLRK